MATLTYGNGDKKLVGTVAADVFIIDLAVLGKGRTMLMDLGGSDTLRLVDVEGGWPTKAFINTGDTLIWKGSAGGRVVIPLNGSKPVVEFLEWSETNNGVGVHRLRLTTDLTPTSGSDIAIIGSNSSEQIILPSTGGIGRSEVYAGGGGDTITASASELTVVYGGRGADLIVTPGPVKGEFFGGAGADVLWGCGGADHLYGGPGKDDLRGFDNADVLAGGQGDDHLEGGKGPDLLEGGKGKDFLYGGAGNDSLRGGNWHDRLFGQQGRDTLYGGQGGDTLTGGKGNDRLSGGTGADSFAFKAGAQEGRDYITDFTDGEDMLRIKGAVFGDLEITQSGADTQITLSVGTVIMLKGIAQAQISVADFDFI